MSLSIVNLRDIIFSAYETPVRRGIACLRPLINCTCQILESVIVHISCPCVQLQSGWTVVNTHTLIKWRCVHGIVHNVGVWVFLSCDNSDYSHLRVIQPHAPNSREDIAVGIGPEYCVQEGWRCSISSENVVILPERSHYLIGAVTKRCPHHIIVGGTRALSSISIASSILSVCVCYGTCLKFYLPIHIISLPPSIKCE